MPCISTPSGEYHYCLTCMPSEDEAQDLWAGEDIMWDAPHMSYDDVAVYCETCARKLGVKDESAIIY